MAWNGHPHWQYQNPPNHEYAQDPRYYGPPPPPASPPNFAIMVPPPPMPQPYYQDFANTSVPPFDHAINQQHHMRAPPQEAQIWHPNPPPLPKVSHQQMHRTGPHYSPQPPYIPAPHAQYSPQPQHYPHGQFQAQHQSQPQLHPPLPPQPQVSSPQSRPLPTEVKVTPKVVITPDRPVDYRLLLLALGDQYIQAAYAMSSKIALRQPDAETKEYHKLLATGLGCYEAVLERHMKMSPRQESLTRLRYATALFQDTENHMELESTLTKGVVICERNKLIGLKYSMQHLLARALHRTKPVAAYKFLDAVIQEAETYEHTPWVYAFRLLRATLALGTEPSDVSAALHNLKAVSRLSQKNGDRDVVAVSAVLEGITHLRTATDDSNMEAQRAIATARAHLPETTRFSPLPLFILLLDLACSLEPYKPRDARPKLEAMQQFLDENQELNHWRSDGSFALRLGKQSLRSSLMADANGVFEQETSGDYNLIMTWLHGPDAYALGFLMSALALYSQNASNGHKAEKFLKEGLKRTLDAFQVDQSQPTESLPGACARSRWRTRLRCSVLLYLAFTRCERCDWTSAKINLESLRQLQSQPSTRISSNMSTLIVYLTGVIQQGTGDLDGALNTYQSPILQLPTQVHRTGLTFKQTIAILATLNAAFITRNPSHLSHHLTASSIDRLSGYFPVSASTSDSQHHPQLHAAYLFLLAALPTSQKPSSTMNHSDPTAFLPPLSLLNSPELTPIPSSSKVTDLKHNLQWCLHISKSLANQQLISLSLAYMCHVFFRGIVGDQAVRAAQAARQTASEAGSNLWKATSDGMLVGSLEVSGRVKEAESVRAEMETLLNDIDIVYEEA